MRAEGRNPSLPSVVPPVPQLITLGQPVSHSHLEALIFEIDGNMAEDWQQNGLQGAFYDIDRQDGNDMNSGHMGQLPGFYGTPGYRGFAQNTMGIQSSTFH